jgi:hypothetical protein
MNQPLISGKRGSPGAPRRALGKALASTMRPGCWQTLTVFQHQIHHCGQAHAMLSGTVVKPRQFDEFFPVAEAPFRAIVFDSQGWAEKTAWGP